ncbi:MAG: P-loop NTPase fold protein [Ancrocorticia sp.]
MVKDSQMWLHWSDEPLDATAKDSLGRDAFVNTVASRIRLVGISDPSTVFGLVGEWGSGKTSILAKVRADLGNDWLIGEFTPWSSGDSGAMALEFVATLADLLGESNKEETKQLLAEYATYATPFLGAIPFVGNAMKDVANQAVSAVTARPPWHKQFALLSEKIRAIKKNVLIIVDDVDRLGSNELLSLLRIVRLLGRFGGVHYLIAYDHHTVEDLLRASGSVGRPSDFMEKIVQYPFEIPPVAPAAVIRALNEILQDLLSATGRQLDETGRSRVSDLVGIIAPMVRTPRTLGRFREQLVAFAGHINDAELDLLDYVAITWLRLNAHEVWDHLPVWKEDLCAGHRSAMDRLFEAPPLSEQEWLSRFQKSASVRHFEGIHELLSFLSPAVTFRKANHYLDHTHSFADQAYFERYLLLYIAEDDVSDGLVATSLDDLLSSCPSTSSTKELAEVLDGSNRERAILALRKASELRSGSTTTSKDFIAFLFDRLVSRNTHDNHIGSSNESLDLLLSREIACAITSHVVTVGEIVSIGGEEQALRISLLVVRAPEFRDKRSEILRHFAEYWLPRLENNPAQLQEAGNLGLISELIVTALPLDQVQGKLDVLVSDFDSYVSLAESFIRFAQWIGTDITYQMTFREDSFSVLVSRTTHEEFAKDVASEAGRIRYSTDDLPTKEIEQDKLRAFAIDSIYKIFGTGPEKSDAP